MNNVTHMVKVRFIILISMIVFLISCKGEDKKTKLAQVHNKFLYLEDIADLIPDKVTREDSLIIIQSKIDLWIRKQSILRRAELNLSDEQKEIEEIVEDYRASLLIEKYKQEYLKQKIDTVIKETEIESYYNDFPENFKLSEEIVRPLYFKFSIKDENVKTFKKYFGTEVAEAKEKMIEIAKESAESFDDFQNNWIGISALSNLLPNDIKNAETFLQSNKRLEIKDKDFFYFVCFQDYLMKGETLPIELAKDQIKIILLNKRKTKILNNLEKKIYQNDVKNGNIKIFVE